MAGHSSKSDSKNVAENTLTAKEFARRIQIASFLRRQIREANVTQQELAELANCAQTTISKICNAKVSPSKEMLGRILEALGLAKDSIDKLPGFGFDPGSAEFQLRTLILRALVAKQIPPDTDAREFIENEWDYPPYQAATRSKVIEDTAWAKLLMDGYFRFDEQGRYIASSFHYDLQGSLILYVSVMVACMSSMGDLPIERRTRALAEFDESLSAWEQNLNHPEKLASAIDACGMSLAGGDQMKLPALMGHAAALKFFLEIGTSVIAGDKKHYATIVLPFFDAVLATLKMAREQLDSTSQMMGSGIVPFLKSRLQQIYAVWGEGELRSAETPTRE